MPAPDSPVLEITNVSKQFPGTLALDKVSMDVKPGEIHGICGENGAGKSTLIKILSGVHPFGSYEGQVRFRGEPIRFASVKDSEKRGIRVIYQELTLVTHMTVADNIFLGSEPNQRGIIDQNALFGKTKDLLEHYGLNVPYNALVGSLGIAQQQLVEIAKALSAKAEVLILDEPTSALTTDEINVLMDILRDLRRRGVTCIYISHKLEELFAITDRITVLRDGKAVGTDLTKNFTESRLVAMMVGREITERFPERSGTVQEPILEVKGWTVRQDERIVVADVSFDLHRGEILGVAGLMGSGRTELVQSLFGEYGTARQGEVTLAGQRVKIDSSRDAIRLGIAFLTEDRKNTSLILRHSVRANASLPSLPALSHGQIIDTNKELVSCYEYKDKLRIKVPSLEALVESLSGGNQQKVALAKWLMISPQILILDEPTRGIDVGTKYEIYRLMNELADQGVGIIMVSSELTEVLGMSTRIMVMNRGRLAGILDNDDSVNMETIMHLATKKLSVANSASGL